MTLPARSMQALRQAAKKRPPGYMQDVLSHCQHHTQKHYYITPQAFDALREKYAGRRAKPQSRGLGDTLAKLLKSIGIKPCKGCRSRQRALNKLVRYKQSNITPTA